MTILSEIESRIVAVIAHKDELQKLLTDLEALLNGQPALNPPPPPPPPAGEAPEAAPPF